MIPDPNTLVAALQSGDVDFVPEGLPYELIPQLNSNPQFNPVPVRPTDIGMLDRLLFNNDEPLFKDVRVRQAFSLAIDRQQVIQVAGHGYGTVSKCIWPASTGMAQYCDPSLTPPEYNVTKAGQLLDQAGYRMQPNGTRIVLKTFLVDNGEPATALAAGQVIRDMLAKVGIMTTIVQVDGNTRLNNVFVARPRLFDISMHKARTGPTPLFARKQFDSSFNTPAIFTNTGFSDPVSDSMWRSVVFNATTNAQRIQLLQQISKRLAGLYPELEIYDYVYAQPLRHSFQGHLFYEIIPESGASENLWFAGAAGTTTAAASTMAASSMTTSAPPTTFPSWAAIAVVILVILVGAYFVYSKKKKK
jgi:peptide/nickel transport system substrate-binding protein